MERWHQFSLYRKRNLIYFQGVSVIANLLLLVMPIYSLQIYNRVLTSHSKDTLLYLVIIVLFLILVQIGMDYTRKQVLNNLSLAYDAAFDDFFVSRTLLNVGDNEQLIKKHQLAKSYIGSQFHSHMADLPWIGIFTVVLFFLHPVIGAYALISLCILLILNGIFLFITNDKVKAAKFLSNKQNVLLGKYLESKGLLNIHLISERITKNWKIKNNQSIKHESEVKRVSALTQSHLKTFRMFVQVGLYAVCSWLVIDGEIMVGALLASSILLGRILAPIDQGASQYFSWKESKKAYDFVDNYLKNFKENQKMKLDLNQVDVFADSLSYTTKDGHALIKNVGFNLQHGKALLITGAPGSGKSTLLKLCAGCLRATGGGIRINGVDFDKIDNEILAGNLAYLPQRAELLDASIADNITGFDSSHDHSDAIMWASKAANCMPFISKLKHGFSTVIGKGGVQFSESERQRIALAGVLYQEPKLLILDEPTLHLDNESRAVLLHSIQALKAQGATVVFISNDNDMRAMADYMIELKDGGIAKVYENKGSPTQTDSVRHINTQNVAL